MMPVGCSGSLSAEHEGQPGPSLPFEAASHPAALQRNAEDSLLALAPPLPPLPRRDEAAGPADDLRRQQLSAG